MGLPAGSFSLTDPKPELTPLVAVSDCSGIIVNGAQRSAIWLVQDYRVLVYCVSLRSVRDVSNE